MHKPLPHEYEAVLLWPGHGGASATAGTRPALVVGAPPEFGGNEAWWSPEHLLLSSLNACLMATFAASAGGQGLKVHSYQSRAKATLNKTANGLAFTVFGLAVTIGAAEEDVPRAREALLKAKQRCIVANALLNPVELELTVEPVPVPEAVL